MGMLFEALKSIGYIRNFAGRVFCPKTQEKHKTR